MARGRDHRRIGRDIDGNVSGRSIGTGPAFGMRVDAILYAGNGGAGVVVDGDVAVSIVEGIDANARHGNAVEDRRGDIGAVVDDNGAIDVHVRGGGVAAKVSGRYACRDPAAVGRDAAEIDRAGRIDRDQGTRGRGNRVRLVDRVDPAAAGIDDIATGSGN